MDTDSVANCRQAIEYSSMRRALDIHLRERRPGSAHVQKAPAMVTKEILLPS